MTTDNTLQINPFNLDLIQNKPVKKDNTYVKLTVFLRACGGSLEKCLLNCNDIKDAQNSDIDPNTIKEFKWKLNQFAQMSDLYNLLNTSYNDIDADAILKQINKISKSLEKIPSYITGADYFKDLLTKMTNFAAFLIKNITNPAEYDKAHKNLITFWDAPAQEGNPAGPGLQANIFISSELSNPKTRGVLLTFLFSEGLTVLSDPNADNDPASKAIKKQVTDILFNLALLFMSSATNPTENHGFPSFDQNFFDSPSFHGPRDYTDVFAGFINQYFNYQSKSKSKKEIEKEKENFENNVPGQHTGKGSDINTPNWNKCQPYLKDLKWQDKWTQDGYSPNGTGFMKDFLINICDYLFS